MRVCDTTGLIDVPSAFVLQLLFFDEIPRPSSIGGAALIVLCTVGSAWRKWHDGRHASVVAGARRFGRLDEEMEARREEEEEGRQQAAAGESLQRASSRGDERGICMPPAPPPVKVP